MNRRSFFSRTVGAMLAGFTAPLLPRKRWFIPIIYRREINPAWKAASHEVRFDYGHCHIDGTPTKVRSFYPRRLGV